MCEKAGIEKQENELVRLIQLLEKAGYRVVKTEIVQTFNMEPYINLKVRRTQENIQIKLDGKILSEAIVS